MGPRKKLGFLVDEFILLLVVASPFLYCWLFHQIVLYFTRG